MNYELPYAQAGFIKARGTRNQNANIQWIIEKDLHHPDNHSVITQLEPDILECEVK